MNKISTLIAGGFTAVLALGMILLNAPVNAESPTWQAVKSEVAVGTSVRLEVTLNGATGPITVTSARLDMGPDGMATMTTRISPIASTTPGVFAFEADLVMAGRWALTLSAKVEGQSQPVTGIVVFTAVEKKAGAESVPTPTGDRKLLYYRNPMGLPDVSSMPKKDSMGMDYIPVYSDEVTGIGGAIRIAPERVQRAGVRTELVAPHDLTRTIKAVATITPDESRLGIVTAKFDGFVEQLLVPLTGSEVRAGQPLVRVWIESKDILQKQADFLIALKRPGEAEQAERNLRLFGISDQEIAQLRKTGQAVRSVVLTAPSSGTVLAKPSVVGMRFSAGDTLFRTADLSTVWAMAQVSERDLGLVRIAQTARITLKAYPNAPIEGRVAFIYPEIDMQTRTASVRIELPNREGILRSGLYADVAIEARPDSGPTLAVPESAIIDNGTKRVVFVDKGNGIYEPRKLTLGQRGGGYVQVRDGLAEGERIVVTGNFLIDAESNLRAALTAFTAPEQSQ
ncbi:MAG: efflux RND transporter periplasmic adaptor subunit [Alphaproteobacteria bacterium]